MRSSKEKKFKHAILIWPKDIEYFDGFLCEHFSEVNYSAQCVDGTSLAPDDLEQLLEYENPNFRRISSLRIVATNGDDKNDETIIKIDGDSSFLSGTVKVYFEFSDLSSQYLIENEWVCFIYLERVPPV